MTQSPLVILLYLIFSGNYDLILSNIIPVMLLQSIHLIFIIIVCEKRIKKNNFDIFNTYILYNTLI